MFSFNQTYSYPCFIEHIHSLQSRFNHLLLGYLFAWREGGSTYIWVAVLPPPPSPPTRLTSLNGITLHQTAWEDVTDLYLVCLTVTSLFRRVSLLVLSPDTENEGGPFEVVMGVWRMTHHRRWSADMHTGSRNLGTSERPITMGN